MGKKRRLMSAKAKFATKHSTHPRMVLLNSQTEAPDETKAPTVPVEVAPEVEPVAVVAAAPVPVKEVALKQEASQTVEVTPPEAKPTVRKKRTGAPKKSKTPSRTSRKSRAKKKVSTEASA